MSSMAKINWGVVLGLFVCYLIAFSLAIAAEQHRSKVQNSNTNLSYRFDEGRHIFKVSTSILSNTIMESIIATLILLFVCLIFGDIIAHWNIAFVIRFLLPVKLSCLFRGCVKHSWG
jgi:Na+/glutamate symporter